MVIINFEINYDITNYLLVSLVIAWIFYVEHVTPGLIDEF